MKRMPTFGEYVVGILYPEEQKHVLLSSIGVELCGVMHNVKGNSRHKILTFKNC